MSTPTPSELERVAESLADSAALDWAALELAHPELGETLARLRALERLAAAHRDARIEAGGTPGGDALAAKPQFVWGPLEVYERLGEGAFGEVYRAHEPALGRDVALKLRRADAAGPPRAWLEEARRLARVSHANVLAVLGVAEHDGRAGFWTELIHGETLEARLAREGPLPAREVALIGVDLCRALAAVHGARLVHGDVKTTNVLCERGADARRPGRIVLADFGAGQAGPPASPATWTPLVSAPEVLYGRETTALTDQYSLGVLLYRLLTARYPYEAETVPELFARTGAAPPPLRELRPDVPPALHDAVLRSLAQAPTARHENWSAFERSLTASLDASAPRHRLGWAAALVGGLGLLLAAVLFWPARLAPPALSVAAPKLVAPAVPEPRRPLAVTATLLRRTSAGSEPLVDGGVVRAGDRLSLALRAGEPAWVYVLNEDAIGGAYALYPRPGLETGNPLAAGVDHRLPGQVRGRELSWQVGEGGGGETFLVVAARRVVPEIESLVARLQAAPTGGRAALERGVPGLVEEPAPPPTSGPVTRLAAQLARERDPDVWVWRVRAAHARP